MFDKVPDAAEVQPSPFNIFVPEERVSELRQLLELSRIGPLTYENIHAEPSKGRFGLTRDWLIDAKREWQSFDWRLIEAELNSFPNFMTTIDAVDIHFIALFSQKADAVPLLLLHGWPGSILEFLPLLKLMKEQYSPQTLPFHLIVPSLPGFGFSSGPPLDHDFTLLDAANILNKLMVELGFAETGYVSHGGDIGSRLSRLLGATHAECRAVHLNFCIMFQPEHMAMENLKAFERKGVERGLAFIKDENAYAKVHASRPATLGLMVSTNPLVLLAWIGEKFIEWTEDTLPLEDILASVSLYWLTDSCARAIYSYRETYGPNPTHHGTPDLHLDKPFGYSYFAKDVFPVPVSWAATTGNLCWSKVHKEGNHFVALQRPKVIKDDLEAFIAKVWKAEGIR